MPSVKIQTALLILLFAAWYLYRLLSKTGKRQLDLYDLVMLSAVAIIPTGFVLFPGLTARLASMAGVAFPFVLLFGALLAVLFLFIHRLTGKIHRLELDNYLLVQELSLLKQKIEQKKPE